MSTPIARDQLLAAVQGDILAGGIPKKHERFVFFNITAKSESDFVKRLSLPATLKLFCDGTGIQGLRSFIAGQDDVPVAIANLSFSYQGLKKLQGVLPAQITGLGGSWEDTLDKNQKKKKKAFVQGMEADAKDLQDPDTWEDEFKGRRIDGVFLIAGTEAPGIPIVQSWAQRVTDAFGGTISNVKTEIGKVREVEKDHEHFGFNDGISQPTVENIGPDNPRKIPDLPFPVDQTAPKGADNWNEVPQHVFMIQDPTYPPWMQNGSFMVFRKLEQDVEAWRKMLEDQSNAKGVSQDLIGAKIVGRWKSGCPINLSKAVNNLDKIADNPNLKFENRFRFDNAGTICPPGAHIQKTNFFRGGKPPFGRPGPDTTRIIRRGIPYGEDFDIDKTNPRGLLFVCYQSSIENGFKFIQTDWANKAGFPFGSGDVNGVDPLMGNQASGVTSSMNLAVQAASGKKNEPLKMVGSNPFVKPKGGEYFFTPSMKALRETFTLPVPVPMSKRNSKL